MRGIKTKAYIPVSEMAYKIDEEFFSYNKDSDEWSRSKSNLTIRKNIEKIKEGKTYKYYSGRENGKMKNHHRLNRALGYGKLSMATQAKSTAIAYILENQYHFICLICVSGQNP